MTYTIRQYQETDLDGVLSSWESANKIAHPFLNEEFVNQVRHDIPNLYLPNADTWVLVIDEKVVGFIALLGNEVGAIFVEPTSHGKGAGKALMDKASSLHATLELDVFKENAIGRKFYALYGFEEIEETTHDQTGQQVLRLGYTR